MIFDFILDFIIFQPPKQHTMNVREFLGFLDTKLAEFALIVDFVVVVAAVPTLYKPLSNRISTYSDPDLCVQS